MAHYSPGNPVDIIRGKYKAFRTGEYLGPSGTFKARVKVHGDTRHERTLMLTSIRSQSTKKEASQHSTKVQTITIPREDWEQLNKDVEQLTLRLEDLKLKLKRMEKNE